MIWFKYFYVGDYVYRLGLFWNMLNIVNRWIYIKIVFGVSINLKGYVF